MSVPAPRIHAVGVVKTALLVEPALHPSHVMRSDYDIAVFLRDMPDRGREVVRLADIGTGVLYSAVALSTPCHILPEPIVTAHPSCAKSAATASICDARSRWISG